MYWCRRPLRGGLFAHVLWVGDRLGRAAAAAGPIPGVLCGSAAGLAEEWIRALRMSSTRVSQPGGFSPASDLGRRSVLRRTVGSRWRHSRRHTSPLCRPEAATTPTEPPPTESPPTEPRTPSPPPPPLSPSAAAAQWSLSARRRRDGGRCDPAVERAAGGHEVAGPAAEPEVCRGCQPMYGGRAGAVRSCARVFAHVPGARIM